MEWWKRKNVTFVDILALVLTPWISIKKVVLLMDLNLRVTSKTAVMRLAISRICRITNWYISPQSLPACPVERNADTGEILRTTIVKSTKIKPFTQYTRYVFTDISRSTNIMANKKFSANTQRVRFSVKGKRCNSNCPYNYKCRNNVLTKTNAAFPSKSSWMKPVTARILNATCTVQKEVTASAKLIY